MEPYCLEVNALFISMAVWVPAIFVALIAEDVLFLLIIALAIGRMRLDMKLEMAGAANGAKARSSCDFLVVISAYLFVLFKVSEEDTCSPAGFFVKLSTTSRRAVVESTSGSTVFGA